jgi:hypothetical protein
MRSVRFLTESRLAFVSPSLIPAIMSCLLRYLRDFTIHFARTIALFPLSIDVTDNIMVQ